MKERVGGTPEGITIYFGNRCPNGASASVDVGARVDEDRVGGIGCVGVARGPKESALRVAFGFAVAAAASDPSIRIGKQMVAKFFDAEGGLAVDFGDRRTWGDWGQVSLPALRDLAAVSFDASIPACDEVCVRAETFILGDEALAWGGGRLGEAGRFVGEGVAEGVPEAVMVSAVMGKGRVVRGPGACVAPGRYVVLPSA